MRRPVERVLNIISTHMSRTAYLNDTVGSIEYWVLGVDRKDSTIRLHEFDDVAVGVLNEKSAYAEIQWIGWRANEPTFL